MVINNKSFAKLKLGMYYFRKSVLRFSENNWAFIIAYFRVKCYASCFRKKKSKEKIFSFQKYA